MANLEGVAQQILSLEKKYWKAMQEHDLETALELTDFPCVVAGSNGARTVDRKKFEEMFNSQAANSIDSVNFDEAHTEVRVVNPETAIIAYQLQSKMTYKGEQRQMSAVDTSTWIKRGNKWVCAMHTETEMQKQ